MAPRGDSAPSAGAAPWRSGGAGAGRGSRCGCGRGSRPGSSRLRGPSAAGTARTAASRRWGASAAAPGGRGGQEGRGGDGAAGGRPPLPGGAEGGGGRGGRGRGRVGLGLSRDVPEGCGRRRGAALSRAVPQRALQPARGSANGSVLAASPSALRAPAPAGPHGHCSRPQGSWCPAWQLLGNGAPLVPQMKQFLETEGVQESLGSCHG